MRSRNKFVVAAALLLCGGSLLTTAASSAGSLDELLEQTRSARQREADAQYAA